MSAFNIYLIPDSECYGDRLIDCSLTKKGMYHADTELPSKLFDDKTISSLDIVNIYCSPTLRTIQTITPFIKGCAQKNKIPVLMFDDSISDIRSDAIKHYFTMKSMPRFTEASPYNNEIGIIIDITCCINNADYMTARKYLKLLISVLSDVICDSVDELNKILVYIDRKINNAQQEDNMYSDIDVMAKLCDIIEKLQSFAINQFVGDHKQLINIDTYNGESGSEETPEMLIARTEAIVDKMFTDDMYKNSVYVTHISVIQAIRYNILKKVYGDVLFRNALVKRFGADTDQSLEKKFITDHYWVADHEIRINVDTVNNSTSFHNL
jgi:broad specificity phosphatase PhoE